MLTAFGLVSQVLDLGLVSQLLGLGIARFTLGNINRTTIVLINA